MNQQNSLGISVVMAVFNGEKFLKEAIESVLGQSYKNLEFIIVDDGSTDRSPEIVQTYQQKDSRIKFIQQQNRGVAAAANKGLENARFELVARMDADDVMLPQRLEKQVRFLQDHPEVAVVSCLASQVNSKGEEIGKVDGFSYLATVEECKKHISGGGIIHCLQPGVVFRKEPVIKVGGYNEKLPVASDTDLWNRLADAGFYTVVMQEELMKYRIHEGALTSTWLKHIDHREWVATNIKRRRKGEAEVSLEEFKAYKKKLHPITKMNNIRKAYGAFVDRTSAVMYGEGKYLQFSFYCLACIIFRPRMTLLRINKSIGLLLKK